MLQLHVTDESGAVTPFIADSFPLVIGRSPQAELRITSAGVWEEHALIRLADKEEDGRQKFLIESAGQSIISINGEVVSSQMLSVGDVVSLGAARITVTLAPTVQSKLAWHESIVWALLLFIVVFEAVVVHIAE